MSSPMRWHNPLTLSEMLGPIPEHRKGRQPPVPEPVDILPESYVYAIQQGRRGLVKIGLAKAPLARLRLLSTGSGIELQLIVAVPGDGALERELHREFADFRVRGEWFKPAVAIKKRFNRLWYENCRISLPTYKLSRPPRTIWT